MWAPVLLLQGKVAGSGIDWQEKLPCCGHALPPTSLAERRSFVRSALQFAMGLANLSLWTFTQHAPSTPAKARGQVAWQLCCPCCVQKSSVDIAPEAGSITTPVSEIAGSSVSMRASKARQTHGIEDPSTHGDMVHFLC